MNLISDQEFINIVEKSYYFKEVANSCNLRSNNGIKKRISSLSLNISHFKYIYPKTNIFDLKSMSQIKKRLITEGKIENKCNICGTDPVWRNQYQSLELDHIDGNRKNNCLQNYRLLCAGCHRQTETHSRNKKYNKYEIQHIISKKKIIFQTFKEIAEYLSTSDSTIRAHFERKKNYKDYSISLFK